MAISVPSNLGVNAPEVKTLYESNPDTNVFTDADVSKLAEVGTNTEDIATVKSLALAGI